MPDIQHLWLFLALLPVVAFLYASVGHGGASGYLALMALFAFDSGFMKPSALLLNLFVAGISFIYFRKRGHFRWNLFIPFALTSVPASFVGGYMNVNPSMYKQILGVLLLIAVLRILGVIGKKSGAQAPLHIPLALLLGAVIGFFSGLIGIGGGIILSPVVLLMNWGTMKETAAVSALFIWVNSMAGMAGLLTSGLSLPSFSFVLVACALVGGFAGGSLGSSNRINTLWLKRVLALVLIIASIKLLLV